MDFYKREEFGLLEEVAGKPYDKESLAQRAIGEQLKKTVFAKTEYWAQQACPPGWEVDFTYNWSLSKHFRKYAWARIFRKGHSDRKVFFTVSADGDRISIDYKLDCLRITRTPGAALSPVQCVAFDKVRVQNGLKEIYPILFDDIGKWNWAKLIPLVREFIVSNAAAYDAAVAAVWAQRRGTLIQVPFPSGGGNRPPQKARSFKGRPRGSVDFQEEQRLAKKLGDAGERLVLAYEAKKLVEAGKGRLVKKIKLSNDGCGYDIASFDETGAPLHIEVKTTTRGIDAPFFLTDTEREYATVKRNPLVIYRLHNYEEDLDTASFFIFEKPMEQLDLTPILFRAYRLRTE